MAAGDHLVDLDPVASHRAAPPASGRGPRIQDEGDFACLTAPLRVGIFAVGDADAEAWLAAIPGLGRRPLRRGFQRLSGQSNDQGGRSSRLRVFARWCANMGTRPSTRTAERPWR